MDSETLIGRVLKTRREECIIATKSHSRTYDEVMADLEESLKELQTDKIDIYQMHELYADDVGIVMGKNGALEAFKKARDQGMIDFIGLTSHHVDLAITLMKTGEFDTVMIPFNVIERDPEIELLDLARSLDIGTMMMKPLAGGAIRNIEKAFRFFNGYPVDVILNGVASLDEFYANVREAENTEPLTEQELKNFEEEVAPLGKDFCRRCSYCLPCPNDLLIPVFIHVMWQKFNGRSYTELTEVEQNMGRNMMMWWQGCEECGKCEEKCPYDLPTIQRKKDLINMFSGE
jgi:predicted aldo/keto reductase-like oxidoreductase